MKSATQPPPFRLLTEELWEKFKTNIVADGNTSEDVKIKGEMRSASPAGEVTTDTWRLSRLHGYLF